MAVRSGFTPYTVMAVTRPSAFLPNNNAVTRQVLLTVTLPVVAV